MTVWAFVPFASSWSPAVTTYGAAVCAVPPSTVTEVIVKPAGVAGTSTTWAEVPALVPMFETVTVWVAVALTSPLASVIGP